MAPVKTELLNYCTSAVGVTSEDFLLLQFQKDIMDKECGWLLGNYSEIVNNLVLGRQCKLGHQVGADQVAGIVRGRLSRLCDRAVVIHQSFNI